MKKLIFASLAIVALASCSKESMEDPAITAMGNQINFNAYSNLAISKGAPVDDNTDFQGIPFMAAAYASDDSPYINFAKVSYDDPTWGYEKKYYWPATAGETLTFAAYSPESSVTGAAYDGTDYTFSYTASTTTTAQQDVMFALNLDQTKVASAPLHFKHALTQVGFAVATDPTANITVKLKSITICNVKPSGKFEATETKLAAGDESDLSGNTMPDDEVDVTNGTWTTSGTITEYTAVAGVTVGTDGYAVAETTTLPPAIPASTEYTMFTSADHPLMLIPQELVAWKPVNIDANVPSFTDCYLMIDCTIAHKDAPNSVIINGPIYIPFNSLANDGTTQIWKAGNKLTYNLLFGGGYPIKPGTGDPDEDESLPTLHPITYTVTNDAWHSIPAVNLDTTTPPTPPAP